MKKLWGVYEKREQQMTKLASYNSIVMVEDKPCPSHEP